MEDSPACFRLLMRSEELPTAVFRGVLRDLEHAYNTVAASEVEPPGRRLHRNEKLRITQISTPASVEIVFSGAPAALAPLGVAIEFLKSLWDQRKAYWDPEKSLWVAEIGKRDFKRLPDSVESDEIRLVANVASDIFSLFQRIEKSESISEFQVRFNGRSLALKVNNQPNDSATASPS